MLLINFRSLVNKGTELEVILNDYNPDILFGVETWWREDVLSAEFFTDEYTVIRRDRNSRGGGVLIAFKSNFTHSQLDLGSYPDSEFCGSVIHTHLGNILIISVYRPQHDCVTLPSLVKYLESTSLKFHKIIIAGDFNLPDIKWQTEEPITNLDNINHACVSYLLHDLGLTQAVDKPTRGNNYLDLVFTNMRVKTVHVDPGISDHDIIDVQLCETYSVQQPHFSKIYLTQKADVEGLMNEMNNLWEASSSSTFADINEMWRFFKTGIMASWDKFVPSIVRRSKPDRPWIDNKIKKLLNKKRRLRKKARISSADSDWAAFRTLRSQIRDTILTNKKNYFHNLQTSSKSNPKAFWRHLKRIRKLDSTIPSLIFNGKTFDNSNEKATIFNDTFKSVFHPAAPNPHSFLPLEGSDGGPPFVCTAEGICKLLTALPSNKSCGPDGVSGDMLRLTSSVSAKFLARIFNKSLLEGVVPEDWKTAAVVPIFKKGSRHDPSNYRPISLTCISCKVMEHIIVSYLYKYLENLNFFSSSQFGFRKGSSCELLLTVLAQRVTSWLDEGLQVDFLLFDFRRAFDMVQHNKLLLKMESYNIDPYIICWFQSFLSGRSQFVQMDGVKSDSVSVTSGVPQGSVSGPLLFLLFINDLPDILQGVDSFLFADDTSIVAPIRSVSDHVLLQNTIDRLVSWCTIWGLPLNKDKTTLLRIARRKSSNISSFSYLTEGVPVKSLPTVKYLGVTLNDSWTWSDHILEKCNKAKQTLAFIGRSYRQAPPESKITLVNSIVRPQLTYCSACWDPHQSRDIEILEGVQRRAARTVNHLWAKDVCVTKLLSDLGWCKLEEARYEHRLSLFYDIFYGNTILDRSGFMNPPSYFSRHDHPQKLKLYQTKHNYARYSFFPRTTFEWNSLPGNVTSSASRASFIKELITRRVNHLTDHMCTL